MAIVTEYYKTRGDGVRLVRTYSDQGFTIRQKQTGNLYDEAIDVEGAPYTYEETDQVIEISAEEALAIITGGVTHD